MTEMKLGKICDIVFPRASVTSKVTSNDPDPVVAAGSGVIGNKTYARLQGGVAGKQYTVTQQVTTNDGLVDRRSYRVYVENRYG